MLEEITVVTRRAWIAICNIYIAVFFLWLILSMTTHGRFPLVNLLNMFAFYVGMFSTLVIVTGFFVRSRYFLIAGVAAFLCAAILFGRFFLPRSAQASAATDTLTVMTFNMLGFSPDPDATLDVIRRENADVVSLQETSFAVAEKLRTEMGDLYPYQIHYPDDSVNGTSIISKYPLTEIENQLGEQWVGKPITAKVVWNGRDVYVINAHFAPSNLGIALVPEYATRMNLIRIREANLILDFLSKHPGPAIYAGDMNDVWLNDPYRTLTASGLQDAWAEAGWGLGHTFPGNKSPGTSRPHVGELYVPEWLVRIDYVLATPEWDVISARNAITDGYSDHRGVVAVLHLK
jgi:endonuclease/exonuclease/phosphatase (EEP) superfamily protein YafD